ncbi:MAG: hypothetical protein XD58_1397 [Thermotoga sp. 50_1627]|uniref:DUF917 domain-containing protein n=1 Tax=Pseudothermotoga sp. TaxID=2033661 RepID=UPI00076D3775|nr:MAG: hypothetical protein XD45_1456 [Thermotoga sp. 50_64]KUK24610.1 MAG: hypothetical protein XD58_1397 [Thermotoga sp. 50_1627]MBC7117135.1 DUF917 domain-containing protein [Pseudothermotoga sp.]
MRIIRQQEIGDIIVGATFLGAGGGGSPITGSLLAEQIESVTLVGLDEVPDDADVCAVAGMGSPAVLRKLGWMGEQIVALERLEEATGRKFDFLVPVEIGAFNSVTPLQAGAVKRRMVVDADGAGRAVPELQMTTFELFGINASPIVLADRSGNSAILYVQDTPTGERIARTVATEFGMQAGIACYAMKGRQLKTAAVGSTLSLAEKVGRAIRNARNSGKNIVEVVAKVVDGVVIEVGTVVKKTEEVKNGFDYGRVYVGETVVDYKNENMIAWKKGKPVVMVPDLICWITTDGQPLTNADLEEGMEVAIIGIKADKKWFVKDGFELFRSVLRSIGYEGEHQPLQK